MCASGYLCDTHPQVPDPAACTWCGYNPPHPDYAGLCARCAEPCGWCGQPEPSCGCYDEPPEHGPATVTIETGGLT